MSLNINYQAGTVQVNGQTYDIKSLGIDPSALSESTLKTYLEGIDFTKFAQKVTNEADSFQSTRLSGLSSNEIAQYLDTTRSDAIQAEIDQLEAEKETNLAKIEKYEQEIEDLVETVENKIAEATKKRNEVVNEHEKEVKEATEKEVKAYVEANKSGKGMTKDELSANIKKAIPNVPNLSVIDSIITNSKGIMNQIDVRVSKVKNLVSATQTLENTISAKQIEYNAVRQEEEEAARQAAEAARASSSGNGEGGNSDPIGFSYNNQNYEFIVDDGEFDSTTDFLGAKNQWAEMQALDTNGDGKVDTDELDAGKIKVVSGNNKGSSARDLFGDNFFVDLKSYDKNGQYAGLETNLDDDGDGIANQQLLGTFNVNINGQDIKGYNTLDDTDWLSNKFGITSSNKTANRGLSINNSSFSETLKNHLQKLENIELGNTELDEELDQESENVNLSKETMELMNTTISSEAISKAENFFEVLQEKNKKKNKIAA